MEIHNNGIPDAAQGGDELATSKFNETDSHNITQGFQTQRRRGWSGGNKLKYTNERKKKKKKKLEVILTFKLKTKTKHSGSSQKKQGNSKNCN